ncbi:MAG: lipoyl synthase [Planctomycetota bacterium]|jgi:lipoic acid synthetase
MISKNYKNSITPEELQAENRRLPRWLTKTMSLTSGQPVRDLLTDLKLNTVCSSAHCPNRCECYGKNRATFLIMGPNCSRQCTFCAVDKLPPAPLDSDEPDRVAEAAKRLELKHAVITSVTRDDLEDEGADHFRKTIAAVRNAHSCTIEVLTPDFNGRIKLLDIVAGAGPDIFNHNIETIERLYSEVRPQADYRQSLGVINYISKNYSEILTKSGIMLGLGEEREETLAAIKDLAEAGCKILTVGQYLAPSSSHHPVIEFVHPDEFTEIGREAKKMGFSHVASEPFVRSSYNAEEVLAEINS